jgi:hypothetical protein
MSVPVADRAARAGFAAAAGVVALSFAVTLVYLAATFHSRILECTEGALQFNAARLRDGLPLWVDPARGAWDYGPVPARFYAAYTGVWAFVLSLFPAGEGVAPARALSLLAWYGLLAWIAATSPPARRRAAVLAALFVGGTYSLALFGSEGRPDSAAILCSGVALTRSVRRDRVGFVDAALFATGAFIKPNVLGLASGALLAEVVLRRARSWPAIAGGAAASAVFAGVLQWASGGRWLSHLVAGNQAPLNLGLWLSQSVSALQFFGVPLVFAGYCALQSRRSPGGLRALASVVSSATWTLLTIAKPGAARNYWMEPAIAGVVVFSHLPLPPFGPRGRVPMAVVALVQALWTGVGSIRSSIEAIVRSPAERAVVENARVAVGAHPGEVILGDQPGIEMMLNGRLVQTPVYMAVLGRAGKYPVDLWIEDISRPEVVGLVSGDDLLERPLDAEDVTTDTFLPSVRVALKRRFVLVEKAAGIYVYGLRERTHVSPQARAEGEGADGRD